MASEVILESYRITIEALAEKHGVSTRRVWMILADMSNEKLAGLDWKDLDAVVQEGLLSERSGQAPSREQGEEVTITTPEGRVLPKEETEEFTQRLQGGTLHLPQSRGRRGMF